MAKKNKLLIIGGGNMGYAIANGMSSHKNVKKSEIIFTESKPERIRFLTKNDYKTFSNIEAALKNNKQKTYAVLLAVKPNDIREVLKELKSHILRDTIIISIAAGIKIKKLSACLPANQPIARIMPNTPCQIGKGMSVITFNKNVSKSQKSTVIKIFKSVGKTTILPEANFDLVTAISGSGPAYFCYLIELLIKSGEKLGLNKKISEELVLETALGTIYLLNNCALSPEALRATVTSPNGTTEAALKVFQKRNWNNIIYEGVKAAKNRAAQLSK